MFLALKNVPKVIGIKQSTKAVREGAVQRVYIAQDASEKLTDPVLALCHTKCVEVIFVPTMKELGEACGIEVGASVVAEMHV